jgi:hypothetical protein
MTPYVMGKFDLYYYPSDDKLELNLGVKHLDINHTQLHRDKMQFKIDWFQVIGRIELNPYSPSEKRPDKNNFLSGYLEKQNGAKDDKYLLYESSINGSFSYIHLGNSIERVDLYLMPKSFLPLVVATGNYGIKIKPFDPKIFLKISPKKQKMAKIEKENSFLTAGEALNVQVNLKHSWYANEIFRNPFVNHNPIYSFEYNSLSSEMAKK